MTTKSDQALCQRLPSTLYLNKASGVKVCLGRDTTGNRSPDFSMNLDLNITAEMVQILAQIARYDQKSNNVLCFYSFVVLNKILSHTLMDTY